MVGDRQGHSQRGHILKLKAQVEQAAAQLEKDKQEFQRKRVSLSHLRNNQKKREIWENSGFTTCDAHTCAEILWLCMSPAVLMYCWCSDIG